MAQRSERMQGGWPVFVKDRQPESSEKKGPQHKNYRIRNINTGFSKSSLEHALHSALRIGGGAAARILSLAPDPTYPGKLIATFSLEGAANSLSNEGTEWTIFLEGQTMSDGHETVRQEVVIDSHFLGFTPLNNQPTGDNHSFE